MTSIKKRIVVGAAFMLFSITVFSENKLPSIDSDSLEWQVIKEENKPVIISTISKKYPKAHWECLLKHLPNTSSDIAARGIIKACRELYPAR